VRGIALLSWEEERQRKELLLMCSDRWKSWVAVCFSYFAQRESFVVGRWMMHNGREPDQPNLDGRLKIYFENHVGKAKGQESKAKQSKASNECIHPDHPALHFGARDKKRQEDTIVSRNAYHDASSYPRVLNLTLSHRLAVSEKTAALFPPGYR